MQHAHALSDLDRALLERIQQEVPLTPRPFQAIASTLDATERDVIERVQALRDARVIRQVSAIFDTRRLGYESSLVAARVAPEQLERAADVISAHPGVSHNYERDHAYNLWFTIAVPPDSQLGLALAVEQLGEEAGVEQARLLPALRVFRIGVNFDLRGDRSATARRTAHGATSGPLPAPSLGRPIHEDARMVEAVRALQRDLPAVEEPFALLAREHGFDPDELLERARLLLATRHMRRFAAVLRHRVAGFAANGMGVWQVPAERLDELGRVMASFEGVSHCYARPTYEDWPYGLFTMTHGRSRRECEDVLAAIAAETGIDTYDVLYSTREFKKERVRYFTPDNAAWESRRLAGLRVD